MEDLNRVFRQVHRVLKVGAPLVFSLPHPAYNMVDADDADQAVLRRAYFDRAPIRRPVVVRGPGGEASREVGPEQFPHTFSDLYLGLARASYRVELVLEPAPAQTGPHSAAYRPVMAMVPPTLIVRARKEGN